MRLKTALAAAGILIAAAAPAPAEASIFEIYVRAHAGYEYLDLTALDSSGLVDPANYDPTNPPPGVENVLAHLTEEYSGNGWAAGGQAGLLLIDFLDVGIDFRQAGLSFDKTDGDLTQIALYVAMHFLGTEMIIDPSVGVAFGYCYLTTQIPKLTGDGATLTAPTQEQTADGFIGRAGAALDFRFVSWVSAGIALDFSFLYFDGGSDRQAWGINTDVLGRLSIHI